MASREASGKVLNAVAKRLAVADRRLGGPVGSSNKTLLEFDGAGELRAWRAMAAATCTSACASTPWARSPTAWRSRSLRPYTGTFLIFSDYMRPPIRLAALMETAGGVRVQPRLHRPRPGRPDPPADRAAGRPARHPGHDRPAPGRRQRDRRGLAGDPRSRRRGPRAWSSPARRCRPWTGRNTARPRAWRAAPTSSPAIRPPRRR